MSERNPAGRYDRTKQLLTRTAAAGVMLWPTQAAAAEAQTSFPYQTSVVDAAAAPFGEQLPTASFEPQAAPGYSSDPVGHLDFVTRFPSGIDGVAAIRIAGWTGDQDAPQGPGEVHFYEGSNFAGSAIASGSRPDVAAAVPGLVGKSGFDVAITSSDQGDQTFCAYGIGTGGGAPYVGIGCETEHTGDAPFGTFTAIQDGARVSVFGGEIDPSHAGTPPIVDITVNGQYVGGAAVAAHDEMAAQYPAYGARRGYEAVIPLADDASEVCAVGIGVNAAGQLVPGEAATLGCAPLQTRQEREFATLPEETQVALMARKFFPDVSGVEQVTRCESTNNMNAQGPSGGNYDYFGPMQVDMVLHAAKFGGLSVGEIKAIMSDATHPQYKGVVETYFAVARQIYEGNRRAWPECGRGVFY
jgi:hypothetical protein